VHAAKVTAPDLPVVKEIVLKCVVEKVTVLVLLAMANVAHVVLVMVNVVKGTDPVHHAVAIVLAHALKVPRPVLASVVR